MKLLDSLLDAIVRLEGDALVMHVGEKPYVITASASMNAYRGPLAWGQVELSSRVLTFDAVSSMLTEILPVDQQRALDEFGAIEHEILPPNGILDRFTVVAARGGEDVWVEVRRKPMPAAVTSAALPVNLGASAPSPTETGSTAVESVAAAPGDAVASADATPPVEEPGAPIETAASPPLKHAEPVGEVHEPPAIGAAPQPIETIVVALPGEAAEEVTLAGLPDDAIQLVDDEQQGVPTEAEVDAMLAATASALLTSGLGADRASDADMAAAAETLALVDAPADFEIGHRLEPVAEDDVDVAGEVELVFDQDAAAAAIGVLSPQMPIEVAPEAGDEAAPVNTDVASKRADAASAVEPQPESPAFELVAPTDLPAEPIAEEITEPAAAAPAGDAPLFSEDAIAAAATAPAQDEPLTEPVPSAVLAAPVAARTEEAPPAPPDPAAPVAVWQEALTVWSTPDTFAAMQAAVEPQQAVAPPEPAARIEGGEPQPDEARETSAERREVIDVPEPGQVPEFSEPLELPEIEEIMRAASEEISFDARAVEHVHAAITPELPDEKLPFAEMRMETTPEPRSDDATIDYDAPVSSGIAPADVGRADVNEAARAGVVVPLARSPIKTEPALAPFRPADDAALMHTLRVAAARGAATVYVVAQSKPMIRVDGEIVPLESEPTLTAADVDRLVLELAPPRRRDALQNGPVEWLCDVPEIGRVRCLTFRDHRGPGVLFRMFPPRAISADQLGLTPEVQALCQQPDGLVLVTGARASGKSTLLNAFVDLINRTRSDHVITIESQIGFVHESRKSFISQRETRGDAELAASVARAALREDPDVLMIEELKSADLAAAAIEAAESGRLVLASMPAASTIGAIERLLELFPADRRARVRGSLATALRGVIAQVLLRRVTGGRVAAREILLNTPAVSTLLLEGKMFQLPVALDSGRRHGMVPLTDSLAGFVRDGVVHPGEAYRKALDRAALVAVLKRDGVDTSFAERLA